MSDSSENGRGATWEGGAGAVASGAAAVGGLRAAPAPVPAPDARAAVPAPKQLPGAVFNAPGEGKKSRSGIIKAQFVLREHEVTQGVRSEKTTHHKERNLFSVCDLLVGTRLIIELKNETQLQGTVENTATKTNDIFLREVEETNGYDGSVRYLSSMMVRGNTIRYLHIPPEINVVSRLATLESLREKARGQRALDVLSGFIDGTTKEAWMGDKVVGEE